MISIVLVAAVSYFLFSDSIRKHEKQEIRRLQRNLSAL
jgi:hypothetical protein